MATKAKKGKATNKVAKPAAPVARSAPVTRSAPVARPAPVTRSAPVARPAPVTRSAPVSRSAGVARSAPAASEGSQSDRLRNLKLQLQAAQDRLLLIDPSTLDDAAHADWSDQIFQLSRAINKLRNVLLEQLSADFAAELPELQEATGKLTDDLQRLKNAVDVINAVAGVLGVVTRIITLLG